jgi:triacylglycerol lipase
MSKKEVAVLVHGLGRTAQSMQKLGDALSREGYDVLYCNYPSRQAPIEELGTTHLQQFVEEHCSDPETTVHFVTHSMGGIVVRYFLANTTLPNLGRVVMIAPPNNGSPYADFFARFRVTNALLGPALKQLRTGDDEFVRTLAEPYYEVGIIAGQHDRKVPLENARLNTMTDFLRVPHGHAFIMNADDVIRASTQFIQTGKFI